MSASLVGSEMCIRDSWASSGSAQQRLGWGGLHPKQGRKGHADRCGQGGCLLYTSDAADDM
eukprot:10275846-Alexandrium_andersonii.AAC.1